MNTLLGVSTGVPQNALPNRLARSVRKGFSMRAAALKVEAQAKRAEGLWNKLGWNTSRVNIRILPGQPINLVKIITCIPHCEVATNTRHNSSRSNARPALSISTIGG